MNQFPSSHRLFSALFVVVVAVAAVVAA